ncbi:hypothetical protein QL285_063521 [Trifolium repens]|nr:hypothetical protein QL285_063521 [Trifolium repens]
MAYRAKEKAVDLVNGSFREQYTRLHDYAHELLKTNAGSTVVIAAQDYVPTEADVGAPERAICPHFQRIQKPIVTMMEEIRVYLMERWQRNREGAAKLEGSVLPKIKKKLEKEIEYTNMWMARQSGEFFFEVRHIGLTGDKFLVNLATKECSCRKWMLTGIPCCHAIASILKKVQKPEDYVPNYYRKETYEACYAPLIYPVSGQSVWEKTQYTDLQPPPIRRQPGRPKKRRNREEGELCREPAMLKKKGMKQGCRRCGEPGHNKSTCKLPPPPPPPPTPSASTTATAPVNTSVIAPTNAAPTPPATAPATTPVIAPTNASGAVAATRKSPKNRDEVPAMPTRKSPRNKEELPATQPAVPTTKLPIKRKRVEAATQPAPATRKSPIKRNKTDQTATPKNQGKKPTKTPPNAPPKAPPKAPFKPPRSSQKPPFKP